MLRYTDERMKPAMEKIKRTDIFIIGTILLAAVLIFFYNSFKPNESGSYAAVYVNNELQAEYPLDEDADVVLEGWTGGTNRLIIEDGEAKIKSASCPDKICASQHPISKTGETIICLPNKVVIKIIGKDESRQENDTDIIAK